MTARLESGRAIALTAAVALVGIALIGAFAPAPAHADVLGIGGAAKDLAGGIAGVPGKLGASVLSDALEWLLGGLQSTITLGLVKFLTHVELPVGGSLAKATGPIIVIGGFFLIVGLITSIGDGYREIAAGSDTAPRVIGQAIFRVIGLALLLGAWFWIVPLAVDVANGMSHYVLSDGAVGSALRRTFAANKLLKSGFPLLGLVTGIFMAIGVLVLVVLKFVIAIAFACLYVGGPALIGFAALPRVGSLPLGLVTRGLFTLTVIPLAWTVVFVAWAGVSAGMFDAATGSGAGVVAALMGPGLFLAGLVVMLAVTKKLLSMASFGLPLSVPGSGMVRSIMRLAVAKALLGAGGAGAQAAKAGAVQSPGKGAGAGAEPVRPAGAGGSAQMRTSAAGHGQKSAFSKLKLREASASPQSLHVERQHQRARNEEAERNEANRDAAAIGPTRRGVFVPREGDPPREDYRALRARMDERAAVERQAATPEQVRQIAGGLPGADRSAIAGVMRQAAEAHPDNPAAAAAEARHAGARHYAGRIQSDDQRGAITSVFAKDPQVVWEGLRGDYEQFQRHGPGKSAPSPPTGGYDPELFTFGPAERGV